VIHLGQMQIHEFGDNAMDSVLFYTFSTIAATFGSAVGIIVAAAIFRMQKVDQIATGLATELMKYHPEGEDKARLHRIILIQDWKKFLDVWRSCHPSDHPGNSYEKHHEWLLQRARERLDRIRTSARYLVGGTLALIAMCFVGLATTLCIQGFVAWDFSFCGSLAFNIPIAVALVFAAFILWLYWRATNLLTEATDFPELP
jgi:hypothetical protein